MATPANLQLGYDEAEQRRNYIKQFEGNPSGNNQAWSGPDAYGLGGLQSGISEFQSGDEAGMNATLAQLRNFDPNASVTQMSRTTGGDDGGKESKYWQLNFDQSKLPKQEVAGTSVGAYGNDRVYNEEAVQIDPHYGAVTDPKNINKTEGFNWLDYAPLLVAGFGFGAPLLAGAMSSGVLGGAAGAAAGGAAGAGSEGLATNLVGPGLEAGETGAFDLAGSYGTNIPGSLGSNLGGAESSLYGADSLANPAQALNSGTDWTSKLPDILRKMPTSKPGGSRRAQGTSGQAEDVSYIPRRSIANALRNQGYQGYGT